MSLLLIQMMYKSRSAGASDLLNRQVHLMSVGKLS